MTVVVSILSGQQQEIAAPGGPATWGALDVAATTTTRFLWPGFVNAQAPTTTIQWRAPRAGTIRNLFLRHGTPAGNGNAIVYTLRVNGVASALTVSLASTSANGSDTVNAVAVAAGDLLDLQVTKAADVVTSPTNIMASLEYA